MALGWLLQNTFDDKSRKITKHVLSICTKDLCSVLVRFPEKDALSAENIGCIISREQLISYLLRENILYAGTSWDCFNVKLPSLQQQYFPIKIVKLMAVSTWCA